MVFPLTSTAVADGMQGGGCLVVRGRPQGCSLELTRFHGKSVARCEVFTNGKWTPIIGTYLPPSTLENLPDLEEALELFQVQDPILLGNLSADIRKSQNPRSPPSLPSALAVPAFADGDAGKTGKSDMVK